MRNTEPLLRWFRLSIIWLALAVGLLILGLAFGSQFLLLLPQGHDFKVETMGELQGGALGVVVGFAGAFAAILVAASAYKTLSLERRSKALNIANETLEESVGAILALRAGVERLLRCAESLGRIVDKCKREQLADLDRDADTKELRKDIVQCAASLAESIKKLLSNSLALALVFSLKRANDDDQTNDIAPLLQDLSQASRWLSTVEECVRSEKGMYRKSFMLRWRSPFDGVLRLLDCRQSRFEEALRMPPQTRPQGGDTRQNALTFVAQLDDLSDNEEIIKTLSYLSYLTAEFEESPLFQISEPRLVALLRYFTYTPEQARSALQKVFESLIEVSPEVVDATDSVRDLVLESNSAKSFYSAGRSDDLLSNQQLRDSQQITRTVSEILGRKAPVFDMLDAAAQTLIGRKTIYEEAKPIISAWLKTQAPHKLKFLMYWSGEWTRQTVPSRYVFVRPEVEKKRDEMCYRNLLMRPLLEKLASRLEDSTLFEAYRYLFDELDVAALRGTKPLGHYLVRWFATSLGRADLARAEGKLEERFYGALQKHAVGLAEPHRRDDCNPNLELKDNLLRSRAVWLCRLAEEARALEDLSKCELTGGAHSDVEQVFTALLEQLNKRLVDKLLIGATAQDRNEIYKHIRADNLWPAKVKEAAFLLKQPDLSNSEKPLPELFRECAARARIEEPWWYWLYQLHLLDVEGYLLSSSSNKFVIKGRMSADGGRTPLTIIIDARLSDEKKTWLSDKEKKWSVEIEVPTPRRDQETEACLRASLQAAFMGYTPVRPDDPYFGVFKKELDWDERWNTALGAIVFELKLISDNYTTSSEGDALTLASCDSLA